MKHFIYFFIFLLLSGAGFYLGSQSNIPGQGLFFANIDGRGPASPQTQLQEAFSHSGLKDEKGLVSLITAVESESFCDVIDDILEFSAIVEAEGVKESGEAVSLSLKGDCSRGEIVVFDKSVCDVESGSLRNGFETASGFFVEAVNLFLPVNKLRFSLASLSLTYRDGSQEMVSPSLDEIKLSFSCLAN